MKFSKLLLTLSVAAGLNITANGQINEGIAEETEVVEETKVVYPYQIQVIDERDGLPFQLTIEDPKIIEARLKSIENIMPMVYNESVEFWLHFFMQRRPNFTKTMMEQTGVYFPIFEKILEEHNMPQELKYLAILESGLNPKAVSRSNAVGLWQFMSFTGKEYGLVVNNIIDERMHPEKSTDAACRYLKYLNRRFNDWDLALASYNTGQGRISRVMSKTGLTNYWDLHPHIHKDTRAYVPQFIALAYLMNFGQLHGIIPEKINNRPEFENIYVESDVDLNILASLTNTNIEELKSLNPHIKATKLPASKYGYEIALPLSSATYFNENRVAVLDSMHSKLNPLSTGGIQLAEVTLEENDDEIVIGRPANAKTPTKVYKENSEKTTPSKTHTIRRGETLSTIAQKYNVSLNDLKKWNNLSSTKLVAGKSLNINGKSTNTTTLAQNNTSPKSVHTVKRGETLWNISKKYEGVSVSDLIKINNLKSNQVIVGQKIRLRS